MVVANGVGGTLIPDVGARVPTGVDVVDDGFITLISLGVSNVSFIISSATSVRDAVQIVGA